MSALSLALLALAPLPDVLELEPEKDNTLYDIPGSDISNGSGLYTFVGRTVMGSLRRTLTQFDVDGAVPAGSRITNVELDLFVSMTLVGDTPLTVHRALESWGEGASDAPTGEGAGTQALAGDATWVYRFFPTDLWTTQGGTFEATPSTTGVVGNFGITFTIPSTPAFVADVQEMLDDPSSNHGWVLRGQESGVSAKRLDSREFTNPALRPKLRITFDPPPSLASSTGTISLSAGGAQALSLFDDSANAGDVYWVLGSVTGTSPGVPFPGGIVLPLNFDPYFNLTLSKPFLGIFNGFLGFLDADGRATPTFQIPPGADPGLAGLTLFHAAAIAETLGTVDATTNPVSVTLNP